MERYNLFQSAHNTLQDVLFDSALTLQHASTEKEEKALQKVNEALTVFDLQVRAKEDYVLPAMDPYEPSFFSSNTGR